MRRETPAFAQQKWPGGTLYHYGLCELAQRQAVLLRKNKSPIRAIERDYGNLLYSRVVKLEEIPKDIYRKNKIGRLEIILTCQFLWKFSLS